MTSLVISQKVDMNVVPLKLVLIFFLIFIVSCIDISMSIKDIYKRIQAQCFFKIMQPKTFCKLFLSSPQYMYFHSGRIPSILEWFLPSWNKSFQKLSDHGKCKISQQQKEIGKKIFQIQFTNIEHEFWGWLSYPNSGTNPEGFLPSWKDLFQDGRNHSRVEGILPEWKYIYCP